LGKFPFYKQLGAMDCGATSLKMIAKYYGKDFSINYLKKVTKITKSGVSFLSISSIMIIPISNDHLLLIVH